MAIINNAIGINPEIDVLTTTGNTYTIQTTVQDIEGAEVLEPFNFHYYNKYLSRWMDIPMSLINNKWINCRVSRDAWSKYDANDAIITGVYGVGQVLNVVNNINHTTENHEIINDVVNIVVTGNLINYRFFGDVVATYTDTTGTEKNVNLSVSVSEGISTAQITISDIDIAFDVVLSGTYQQFADITNNIPDTSLSYFAQSHDLRVTITGTDILKRFTGNPVLTYTDTEGTRKNVNLSVSVSEGISTAQIYLTDAETPQIAEVNGIYEQFVNIQNAIQNTETEVTAEGASINISLRGLRTDFLFSESPKMIYQDIDGNRKEILFSVTSYNTADISVNDCNTAELILITGVYEKFVYVRQTLTSCSVVGVPEIVTKSTFLDIQANANRFFAFETLPKLVYQYIGRATEINFTQGETNETAVFVGGVIETDFDTLQYINLIANAVVNTDYVNRYGTINFYKVSEQNLKDFAKKRFSQTTYGETPFFTDYGDYVCSVKRFYGVVGETLPNVIKCGNYNTQINTETPLEDTAVFDCGFVDVPMYNNNVTDYETEINLYLPFIGIQNVSSDYVGKRIAVKYKCNLITCDAVCELSSDGIIFNKIVCNLANDVIYKQSYKTDAKNWSGKPDFNVGILQGLEPYVIVKYYNSANEHLYNSGCERVNISNVSGFAKLEEVRNFISDSITKSEKDLLISLLADGVIII